MYSLDDSTLGYLSHLLIALAALGLGLVLLLDASGSGVGGGRLGSGGGGLSLYGDGFGGGGILLDCGGGGGGCGRLDSKLVLCDSKLVLCGELLLHGGVELFAKGKSSGLEVCALSSDFFDFRDQGEVSLGLSPTECLLSVVLD